MSENNPIVTGHLFSDELTVDQKKLANYLAYFAKIGVVVSQSEALIKIEKAKGMQMYLKELKKAESAGKKLSEQEKRDLEDSIRFVTAPMKLGGATTIIRELLAHACTGDKFNEMMNKVRDNALKIADYSTSLDVISKGKKTDFL